MPLPGLLGYRTTVCMFDPRKRPREAMDVASPPRSICVGRQLAFLCWCIEIDQTPRHEPSCHLLCMCFGRVQRYHSRLT